jgi:hypothetical protein
MAEEKQEKKLIIDEDWKEEAQREKETLAAAIEREKAEKLRRETLPPASVGVLISSLATQALMSLGDYPNPVTKKAETKLDEAKFHIDMLGVLEEKTKGHLSPDEARMLEGILFDLRMRFVEKSKEK